MLTLESLKQCAINNDCAEGKTGYCSRWHCRLLIKCEECGWQGETKDAVHGYTSYPVNDYGDYESEATDECPKCGSENLIEL